MRSTERVHETGHPLVDASIWEADILMCPQLCDEPMLVKAKPARDSRAVHSSP